jgi:DNA-binding NtrC family response regulator
MDKATDKIRVLVVDEEKSIRVSMKVFLEEEGFMVTTADGFSEAMLLLAACDFDVAVVDRNLSNGRSGLDLIAKVGQIRPLCQTILITAYPTFESAVHTLKSGAYDYLAKPVARNDIYRAVRDASQTSVEKRREQAESCAQ